MKRRSRSKAFAMLLAAVFGITILAFLSNISTNYSLTNKSDPFQEDAMKDTVKEDTKPVITKPDTSAKDLIKPKKQNEWKAKNWGSLSPEIEEAIENNVKIVERAQGTERILLTAVVNSGMVEYTLNWIASLKNTGLDDKFLVFAIDQELVDTLVENGYGKHVVIIPKDWFHKELSDGFEAWLSSGYTPITHSKTLVVERLLYTDVTVWFSDVDIAFTSASIYDYLLKELDSREGMETLFSMETKKPIINSGFYVMRPTLTNKHILESTITIQDAEAEKKTTQQRAMNRVLVDMKVNYQTGPIGLLDLDLFPHGRWYFERNLAKLPPLDPMMVHANYRQGDQKKIDMKKFGLWYI